MQKRPIASNPSTAASEVLALAVLLLVWSENLKTCTEAGHRLGLGRPHGFTCPTKLIHDIYLFYLFGTGSALYRVLCGQGSGFAMCSIEWPVDGILGHRLPRTKIRCFKLHGHID